MKKILLGLLLCSSLVIGSVPNQAKADDSISVKLINYLGNVNNINLTVQGTYQVGNNSISLNQDNQYQLKLENGKIQLYENGVKKVADQTSIIVNPLVYGINNLIYVNGKPYTGTMNFQIENNTYIRPTNTLPFEDYLKGVVPNEMPSSWQLEALKSQAVAARTYAKKYGTSTISDTQSYQVYGGYSWASNSNNAVNQTNGQYLVYNGNLAQIFYSSSNGGKILSNRNSWGSALIPYLQTKDDPYDLKSGTSNVNWSYSLYKTQIDLSGKDLKNPNSWWTNVSENPNNTTIISNLKTWLKANDSSIPNGSDIKIVSIPSINFTTSFTSNDILMGNIVINYIMKTPNGYSLDSNGNIKINQTSINKQSYSIRSIIGSSIMKSPYIKSVVDNGTTIQVNGGGYGHGIGMSQYGAGEMAKEGFNYQQILSFYFPGTVLNNPISVPDATPPTISNFQVKSNYANYIKITYNINEGSTVIVNLRDTNGNFIKQLFNGQQKANNQEIDFDGANLQKGIYTVEVIAKDSSGNQSIQKLNLSAYNTQILYTISTTQDEYLYTDENDNTVTTQIIPKGEVSVVNQDDVWYEIKINTNYYWIKPTNPIVPNKSTITLNNRRYLYDNYGSTQHLTASVSPQTVQVISEWKGTKWFQINTWLGKKWINLQDPYQIKTTTDTWLYAKPDTHYPIGAKVSSQNLIVVGQESNWLIIKTWLGNEYIKPTTYINEDNKTIITTENHLLYQQPDMSYYIGTRVSPQPLSYKEIEGNWAKIQTWLGDEWVQLN